ncbi:MAG TPA: hypothetical protein VG387_07120 [Rhizomicrobium sp.]|jgi:hypothetical protein|nr:hypothetical protein [Rhizomicrobium sp.]
MAQDWKSLLTQLVVIAAGVLVALGIGHGLESWSWNRAANDTVTKKIEPELHEAMDLMAERVLVAPCIKNRLDGLEAQLLAANGKWTPIAPGATGGMQAGNILPVPVRDWNSTAWTSAVADGTAAHLDDAHHALYALTYRQVEQSAALGAEEFEAAGRLNVLTKPVTLSPDQVVALVGALEEERARNRLFALNASEAFRIWQESGRDPKALIAEMRKKSPMVKACMGAGRVTK